jgi:hypothetical protein
MLPACASTSEGFVDRWYPHADNEGMGETDCEHFQRVVRLDEIRRRQLVDDLDLLFMTERNSRLTRWHER